MDLFIVNSPAELPWQTNLYDLLIFAIVVTVVVNAVVQYRRGTRMWLFVLIASLVYGIVLELAGMATLNMYLQGDFLVMLNFPAIPSFAGTTAMPLYVTFFYPVIFAIGFKIVESLGIESRWKAAVAGGLFMVCLDALRTSHSPGRPTVTLQPATATLDTERRRLHERPSLLPKRRYWLELEVWHSHDWSPPTGHPRQPFLRHQ
jgi:hypothetical protein